jgi:hypothetical protein
MASNNPGGITDTPWSRKQPGYIGAQGPFAAFDTADDGNAAMLKLLNNYAGGGVNTISGMISKWSPPSANPTANYIDYVAKRTGLDPNAPLDPSQIPLVGGAMSEFEVGTRPKSPVVPLTAQGTGNGMPNVQNFDASGRPVEAQAPRAAPVPLASPAPAIATPAASQADDDALLAKYLGSQPATASAPATAVPQASDDALLEKYLGAGKPQTGAADASNPMAVRKSSATTATAAYTPSSVPWLDPISAFANSAVDAIPVIGPTLTKIGNSVDAGVNNLLGYPSETAADRADINTANAAQNPLLAGAGSVAGTVVPLVAAGATGVGAKLLGTSGNMLPRAAMGGFSGGLLQGADTIARGGNIGDAARNALIAMGAGAAAPLAFGGNMLTRTLGGGAMGAVLGGGATLAQGGSLADAEGNAARGGVIGAGAGAIGGAANNLLRGGGVSPEVAQLAQAATDKYGIPLRAGQITTNPLVNRADALVNKLPMSGGTASYDAQTGAFTKAIAAEMGSPNVAALSPQVMGAAKSRIGGVFQSVANKIQSIPADPQFDNDLIGAMSKAQGSMTPQQFAPLERQFNDIVGTFQNGGNAIDGKTYLAMTARGSPLDAAMSSTDPAIAGTAVALKDALDGAMQRAASPADAQALQQARYQWKVMRTVEDLAEKAPTGGVSPPLLMGAVRKNFPNMAYDGGGNMGELARIGQQFLKPPSSSGTAENLGIMKAAGQGLGLGGGGLGAMELAQNPGMIPAAIGGVAALGAGSAALGAVMRSRTLANKLIQSGLRTPPPAGTIPMGNLLTRAAAPPAQNMLLPYGPGGPEAPLQITVRGASAR